MSSFPHEQIQFDLAALQFEEGNEKYILFLEENNEGNITAMQVQLRTKDLTIYNTPDVFQVDPQ